MGAIGLEMAPPPPQHERNQEATCYVGDLDAQVDETLLWELMLQAGPVVNVFIPKDKLTNVHMGFGFVEFRGEEDADYAIKIMNTIKMFGKPIRVNKASRDKKTLDVGANLFIGNLDPDVDEKLLYDTFSAFGVVISTRIMRDPDTGNSRGFGFVSFDDFGAADASLESMNGQYLSNRAITVSYDGENALVIELVGHFHVGILEVEVELCIADFVHDTLEIDAIRSLGLEFELRLLRLVEFLLDKVVVLLSE